MEQAPLEGFRLSPQQRRLWRLHPDGPPQVALCAALARGALRVDSLRSALQAIVDRHEIFRTTFHRVPAMSAPLQVVAERAESGWRHLDLQTPASSRWDAAVAQLLDDERRLPFDLERGPTVRATLVTFSAATHLVMVSAPALCADRWTMHNVFRELVQGYGTAGDQETDEPVQYVQYSEWQHALLEADDAVEGGAYWTAHRPDGGGPLPTVPFSRDVVSRGAYPPASMAATIDPAVSRRLQDMAETGDACLWDLLFGAWQLLLWRLASGTPMPVGYTYHGRKYGELHGSMGLFAKRLPVTVDLQADLHFGEVLAQVRTRVDEGREWGEYFTWWDGANDDRLALDFDYDEPVESLDGGGVRFSLIDVSSVIDSVALKITCAWRDASLVSQLEYDPAVFDSQDMARLLERYHVLLQSIVASPPVRIGRLSILGETERRTMLIEWQGARRQYPGACVHQLFAEQAKRTPSAPALVFEQDELTYQELDGRANQVAHRLRSLGVRPEVLVALCVERSAEMVVGVLGILKAGGGYLPLDPRFPDERLASMMRGSGTRILLTQEALVSKLPTDGIHIVRLDADGESIRQEPVTEPQSGVLPDHAAYVMYTSGSTGPPKGVVVEHRQLLNYCCAIQERLTIPRDGSFATVSSIAADLGNTVIFPPLCTGGCLHVIPWTAMFDAAALAAFFRDRPVDCLKVVPSHLAALLEGPHPEQLLPRRCLVLGGESWPWSLADRLVELAAGCRILNHYGPTETTVGVLTHELGQEPAERQAATPPLGRPIPNVEVYVLDADLEPVPVGLPGEIYIGGAALARGYLGRPAATAERFIPHPFASEPGSRLYQTGDRARYLPDGTIEFLGRFDNQVQIRGYRVEPGEIEAALRQMPQARDAVVTARSDDSSEVRLIAYVVADPAYLNGQREQAYAAQLAEWQLVFDDTYRDLAPGADPTFNALSWNSSYTGETLPDAEIREQVDAVVHDVLALEPDRVLEIGCGTGLLLFPIAPHCSRYWATDFSKEVLEYTGRVLRQDDHLASRVTLLLREASDFSGFEPGSLDTVILNSVVQYFPSLDYLSRVIDDAARVVRPGGRIFLGDIRSLPLLAAFHTSVQLYRAPSDLPAEQLERLVRQQLERESELIVDPAFFDTLAHRLSCACWAEIRLKRGRYRNELTKFRYDVILHLGSERPPASVIPWRDWQQENLTVPALRELLLEASPELLGVSRVPNARVVGEYHISQALAGRQADTTAGHLQAALEEIAAGGVDPDDLWDLGRNLGFSVGVTWSGGGAPDCFDVVFSPRRAGRAVPDQGPVGPRERLILRPGGRYATMPLQEELVRTLTPELRSFLGDRLPDHLIPATVVLLESLPLTPNGKIDYESLPVPSKLRPEMERPYAPPRTPVEAVIAGIWAQVLRLERVGIHDDFFELGGHSLLATQVISRVRTLFQVALPLRVFFETTTVAALAEALVTHQETPGQVEKIAEIVQRVEAMSPEEVQDMLETAKARQGQTA